METSKQLKIDNCISTLNELYLNYLFTNEGAFNCQFINNLMRSLLYLVSDDFFDPDKISTNVSLNHIDCSFDSDQTNIFSTIDDSFFDFSMSRFDYWLFGNYSYFDVLESHDKLFNGTSHNNCINKYELDFNENKLPANFFNVLAKKNMSRYMLHLQLLKIKFFVLKQSDPKLFDSTINIFNSIKVNDPFMTLFKVFKKYKETFPRDNIKGKYLEFLRQINYSQSKALKDIFCAMTNLSYTGVV